MSEASPILYLDARTLLAVIFYERHVHTRQAWEALSVSDFRGHPPPLVRSQLEHHVLVLTSPSPSYSPSVISVEVKQHLCGAREGSGKPLCIGIEPQR